MFRKITYRQIVVSLLVCCGLPMMFGLNCLRPIPPAEPVTLVDETFATSPITKSFPVSAANKVVTCTVTGNVTSTRITVAVFDPSSVLVANDNAPTSSSTTVSYVSTTAGTFNLQGVDAGTSTLYTVLITEQ